MVECILCGKKLKKFCNHLKKHNLSLVKYFDLHVNPTYNIRQKYLDGFSAQQIANEIEELTNSTICLIKKDILLYLKNNNIEIRTTSNAIKCWVEKIGGVWNKGLTKETSSSVKIYADKQLGENNSFYKTDINKRIDTYYDRIPEEEVARIFLKMKTTLNHKYQVGELVHWSKKDPERHKIVSEIVRAKQLENMKNKKHKYFPISAMEKKIGEFLKILDINYLPQQSLGYYAYDFLLDKKIIIEYNGRYWHCDPRFYKEDYWHSKKKQFASQIWEKDKKKRDLAENLGYKLIVLWEDDIKKLTDEQIKEHLANIIQNS